MTILVLSQFSDIIKNDLDSTLNDVVFVDNFKEFDLRSFHARVPFELLICFGYNRILPVADPVFCESPIHQSPYQPSALWAWA